MNLSLSPVYREHWYSKCLNKFVELSLDSSPRPPVPRPVKYALKLLDNSIGNTTNYQFLLDYHIELDRSFCLCLSNIQQGDRPQVLTINFGLFNIFLKVFKLKKVFVLLTRVLLCVENESEFE